MNEAVTLRKLNDFQKHLDEYQSHLNIIIDGGDPVVKTEW